MSTVADAPRPGQAYTAVMPQAIQESERMLRENGRVTVVEVAVMLDIRHGSTHRTIHKVSAR